MSKKNPKVDAFLKRAAAWGKEMESLRAILLGFPLDEEIKWGKPCYTFEGANVVVMAGFKQHCVLIVAKGALLSDPHGILVRAGENTQAARQIRLTSVQQIAKLKPALMACLQEAIDAEKAGLQVEYQAIGNLTYVVELQEILDRDPAFKAAFEALTPGRRRAYNMHFSAPKQSKTRTVRVEKAMPQILAGKGLNEEYTRRGKG